MAPFFTSLLGFGSRTIGGLGRAIMNPIKKVGGLLGNAGKAGAYYGLGNALFGGNNNEEQIQSGGSGGGEMGGFGGTVSGATPVSTAASATSALSDADSSGFQDQTLGDTGIFFVNSNEARDELVSRNRAILYSMIL